MSVVDRVRQAAGSTVAHTGNAIGGAVQNVAGRVPSPGGTVSQVGAAAGGAISGGTGAVGRVLGGS